MTAPCIPLSITFPIAPPTIKPCPIAGFFVSILDSNRIRKIMIAVAINEIISALILFSLLNNPKLIPLFHVNTMLKYSLKVMTRGGCITFSSIHHLEN